MDESHCLGINQNYGSAVYEKQSSSYTCPGQPNTCDHNACSCDVQLAESLSILGRNLFLTYNRNENSECQKPHFVKTSKTKDIFKSAYM